MKKKLNSLYAYFIIFLSGGVIGIGIASFLFEPRFEMPKPLFLALLIVLLVVVMTYLIHVIIHEFGHMVFGLLSGYKLVSFRIGSYILIKNNDKYVLKKYSLPGTGGQCLMSPPDMIDGRFPTILYNLGGIIMNLLFVLIFYLLKLKASNFYAEVFSHMMIFNGIHAIVLNGIPLKSEQISNDAYNVLHLAKDDKARKAFWLTLKTNDYLAQGIRLKDMDDSLFNDIDDEPSNTLAASTLLLKENRYMDQKDFERAENCIERLMSKKSVLNGISKNMLKLDAIYINLIDKKEINDDLENKEMKAFIKAMANNPSIIRSQYAYYLAKNDNLKAEELEKHFNNIIDTYPYLSEIETEKELMVLAKQRLAK